MKKLILLLFLLPFLVTAQIQMSQVSGLIPKLNSKQDTTGLQVAKRITAADTVKWNAKQNQINGTGFVKSSGTALSYDNSSYYPSSNPNGYTSNAGTVTSVSGFTLGTTGTDISTSVQNNTTTPLLGINIPTASATNRGALSSIDWSRFDGKQSALGFTPEQQLTFGTGLSRAGNTITNSFTAFKTVNSVSVVGNGDIPINPFPGFGTGSGAAWGYTAHPTTISGYGITDTPWTSYLPLSGGTLTGAVQLNTNHLNFNQSGIRGWDVYAANGNFNIQDGDGAGLFKFNNYNVYHSGNLTSSLSINYIPKWNGSSFVNSLISSDGTYIYTGGNKLSALIGSIRAIYSGGDGLYFTNQAGTKDLGSFSEAGIFNTYSSCNIGGNLTIKSSSPLLSITSDDTGQSKIFFGGATNPTRGSIIYSDNANDLWLNTNGSEKLRIFSNGNVGIGYATNQGYKLSVNGTVSGSSFSGSASNLTNLPINLVTSRTSGAATWTPSTNTLDLPNYTASSGNGNYISATSDSGSSRYLTNSDCWVTSTSSSATFYCYMPSAPTLGKVFYIRRSPNAQANVMGNGSSLFYLGTSYSTFPISTSGVVMIVWDGSYWQITVLN